ncbi:META domain-containing protein [Allosphingosinicella vermicomposti]|uniref:META domain-containing protein n=1 Tax=Allosphingosinicella vermicomposti TaxID=614671 RepID=UPI000D10432B|nr:META domain-containing protein [Allosphingosinicella vermicomposti]
MKTISTFAALLALSACSAEMPPPSQAPVPPGAYRALGTEPGWTVTIEDDRIVYDGEYGEVRFSVPRPEPRTTFNGHRYEARSATHSLTVDITHQRCNDGMSDRIFTDTVMVIADGKTFRGCGGDILSSDELVSLADTRWTIAAIAGEPVEADGRYFLNFTADRMNGKAGCNNLSGRYGVAGSTLTAGPIAATKMACPEPYMAREQKAFDILSRPAQLSYQDGDTVIVRSAAGEIVLKRAR